MGARAPLFVEPVASEPPPKTCRWYVSVDQPECGDPAVATVKLRTRVAEGFVDLCRHHKAVHDENAARLRATRGTKN